MFKLFGSLIIINSIIVGFWLLTSTQAHKVGVLSICALAIFAGCILMLQDRAIEITVKGVGKIKAAAEQATSDANAIAEIKERIEAQSATVDLVAEKAASTVNQLQNIACTIAEAALTDSMAGNFMGGIDLKTRLDSNYRIIDSLIEIGVSKEKIKDVKKMWSKGIGIIYHRGIRNALEGRTDPQRLNMKASPELKAASKEFQETQNFKQWEVLHPDEMESFIEGKGFMNETVRELISDYRHFLETGNIRRRSVFEQL